MYWKSTSFRSRKLFLAALKEPNTYYFGITTILLFGGSIKFGYNNIITRNKNREDELEILEGIKQNTKKFKLSRNIYDPPMK
eukprot:gene3372-5919_t